MFRKIFLNLFAVALLSITAAQAAERGTKEEAMAMALKAAEFAKQTDPNTAYTAFSEGKDGFKIKDLYVVTIAMDGDILAHGQIDRLVGKNMLATKDATGKPYVQEMVNVAKSASGEGWVDYLFKHPTSNSIEKKSAFIKKVDADRFLLVGTYQGNQ